MKVVHLKRVYLARTETFIYSQLSHLKGTESLVLTRELQYLDQFPWAPLQAFSIQPSSRSKRLADLSYRYFRHMMQGELAFYISAARTFQADILHAHYLVDAAYFIKLKSSLRLPLVISCYGYDVSSFPKEYWGYGRRYLQQAVRAGDIFLAMSQDMKQDLIRLGVDEKRITIHYPNGVNLAKYPFSERRLSSGEKVRILFVGTFIEKKGAEYLLAAFADLHRHYPNVELKLVGEGPLRSRLEAQIKALGLENNVILAGFVDHSRLTDEFAAAHLFCLPSVTAAGGDKEGIPTVLVEAQATGLPVISTRHAGIPDAVLDGQSGYLVPERDVKALAEKMIDLVTHPEEWARMGKAGRMHVQTYFDVDALGCELEEIYARVSANKNPNT